MFIDMLEFRIENKKKSLGKTVMKMRSQTPITNPSMPNMSSEAFYLSTKVLLEKVQKLKTTKNKKIIKKTFISLSAYRDKTSFL